MPRSALSCHSPRSNPVSNSFTRSGSRSVVRQDVTGDQAADAVLLGRNTPGPNLHRFRPAAQHYAGQEVRCRLGTALAVGRRSFPRSGTFGALGAPEEGPGGAGLGIPVVPGRVAEGGRPVVPDGGGEEQMIAQVGAGPGRSTTPAGSAAGNRRAAAGPKCCEVERLLGR